MTFMKKLHLIALVLLALLYFSCSDKDKSTLAYSIFEAVKNGDLELVEKNIAAKVNVHAKNDKGNTPLHIAAEKGHTEIARALMAVPGIDVNAKDDLDYTPLHLAAIYKHTELAKALIAAPGIDVNAEDFQGTTPLHIAANKGHTELARALMATPGIDMNATITGGNGDTPLHEAAFTGHIETLKAIVKAFKERNRGNHKAIREFIEARNKRFETPADMARQEEENEEEDETKKQDYREIIKYLASELKAAQN